jgi:hypothetical protein
VGASAAREVGTRCSAVACPRNFLSSSMSAGWFGRACLPATKVWAATLDRGPASLGREPIKRNAKDEMSQRLRFRSIVGRQTNWETGPKRLGRLESLHLRSC